MLDGHYIVYFRMMPQSFYTGIQSFLSREDIPVDKLDIRPKIPRDRRHASKPNTAALFKTSDPNSLGKLLKFFLKANPLVAVVLICVQLLLIVCVLTLIILQ